MAAKTGLIAVWPRVRVFVGAGDDRKSKVLERGDDVPELDVTQRENLLSFGAIAGALPVSGLEGEVDGDDPVADFNVEEGGSVEVTEAWVGDDAARAQQVLDVEAQRPEGKQRKSLIKKLDAVIAAGQ